MRRLFLLGVVVALGLGHGIRAQNARPPAAPVATAPRAATPAPAAAAVRAKDWPTVGNDPGAANSPR